MAEKEKRLKPFTKGLLIYIAVFLLISVIALGLLYGFLSAYEVSRPSSCIESYISDIGKNGLPAECEEVIASLGPIKSQGENRSYLLGAFSSASWKKDVKNSSSDELKYILIHENGPLGSLLLRQTGKEAFGFTCWEVCGAEFDLSAHVKNEIIDVPASYTVCFNGQALDSSFITDSEKEYEALDLLYDYDDYYSECRLPRLLRYETGGYMGDGSISVKDADGRELSPEELSEEKLLNNCDDSQLARMQSFLEEFFDIYVYFGGNVEGNFQSARFKVLEMVQRGSPLDDRLRGSFEAYGFGYSKSCEVLSLDINILSQVEDRYLVDITYVTEIVGVYDPVQVTSHVKLVVIDTPENGLMVEVMMNY